MSETGRRERKKQETRERIAGEAMRLFVERGFDAVSMADVAEAADVSPGTVFNHFRTKEDLFFGLHEPMERGLGHMVRERPPGEPLVTFLRRNLDEALEHFQRGVPDERRSAVVRVIEDSRALRARTSRISQEIEDDLAAALAADTGAPAGDFRARIVASQVLNLYDTLFAEGRRRQLLGEDDAEVRAALRAAAGTALELLESGIADYGRAGSCGRT